jgi:hypothetical protein
MATYHSIWYHSLGDLTINTPPKRIDDAVVVYFAQVLPGVKPTEATVHSRDGQILGRAQGLAICRYPGETSFYLFYCDEDWMVRTDTFHLTLEDAKRQAEFEYEGISMHWKEIG